MNHYPVVMTGGTNTAKLHRDIDINAAVLGTPPFKVGWFHRGVKVFDDARVLHTKHMARVPTARYGLYQFKVEHNGGDVISNVLFTPNIEEGKSYLKKFSSDFI